MMQPHRHGNGRSSTNRGAPSWRDLHVDFCVEICFNGFPLIDCSHFAVPVFLLPT